MFECPAEKPGFSPGFFVLLPWLVFAARVCARRGFLLMPRAALRPCTWPGCGALVEAGRCAKHQHDRQRESSTVRGYGYRWQQASKQFLRLHPLCQCEECKEGLLQLRPSTVVDHKVPHRGDLRLMWDQSNWQAMAKTCHDKKTAREDGGFGRGGRGGG